MVALAGMRRRLHLPQQRVHFLGIESAAGAYAAMAGHGGTDRLQPFLEGRRLVQGGEVVGRFFCAGHKAKVVIIARKATITGIR